MASSLSDDRHAQLRDAELWNLSRAAVQGAGAAADAYLKGSRWRPRVVLGSVGAFSGGWPNLSRSLLSTPDDALTDYSQLFSVTGGSLSPIAYAEVPELGALIEYVRSCEHLKSRVWLASETGDTDLDDRMLAYHVADLPLSLLARARATGAATDDDDLLLLYLERERAWLLDPLPVELVIPLSLTALDLDAPLVIDDSTRLEPLDAATQRARAPSNYSVTGVPNPVVGAATHAVVLSGRQLPNPGPLPRMLLRVHESLPIDDADLVCRALRTLTDIDVGYAQVLLRPLGWADRWDHDLPPLTPVRTVRRYPEWFDDYGWLREPKPIGRAVLEALPDTVAALRAASPRVVLAARRLSLAVTRSADDDRTIDACIGLEALLGEGRDELSHRLALRAATALATRPANPLNPERIYEVTKKIYAHRSAVVHGTPGDRWQALKLDGESYGTAGFAVELLRVVLADALSRPGGWTPSSLDSALLAALTQHEDPTQ
jgi:hypothetical protein